MFTYYLPLAIKREINILLFCFGAGDPLPPNRHSKPHCATFVNEHLRHLPKISPKKHFATLKALFSGAYLKILCHCVYRRSVGGERAIVWVTLARSLGAGNPRGVRSGARAVARSRLSKEDGVSNVSGSVSQRYRPFFGVHQLSGTRAAAAVYLQRQHPPHQPDRRRAQDTQSAPQGRNLSLVYLDTPFVYPPGYLDCRNRSDCSVPRSTLSYTFTL
ncbi:hypothetical protein AVEN_146275-1 [Araneus ventricosus]|uniref:Uncharacterized protein n=1 Tax=Araneus ventricosus TaxID=182803 RepID=A0A4Y2WNT4_ARAVE|nr:hypothetical protein AVEN_146275-1 [Araneus ventricosus]